MVDEGEIDLRDEPRPSVPALALHAFALRHLLRVDRPSPHVMIDELDPVFDELAGVEAIGELCRAGWWRPDDRIPGCYRITERGLASGIDPEAT